MLLERGIQGKKEIISHCLHRSHSSYGRCGSALHLHYIKPSLSGELI